MGREVRMVPPDWEHPRDGRGAFIPLHPRAFFEGQDPDMPEGERIEEWHCMPDFGDRATHLCMYEDTTEGTPMSPAFATAEELARWLVDSGASVFGEMRLDYEGWLDVIENGSVGIFASRREPWEGLGP